MRQKQKLYPKPRVSGFLSVGDEHRLYYELVGSPAGIPCVFFHGGPGGGFNDSDKRFFDFKRYQVLFFDQRGAGRSKPFASIEKNTTQELVRDTFKIMQHVGFSKALYFGGSWGSTLALLCAIKEPKRCLGLILRGTYLANAQSNNYFLEGGWRTHLPQVWQRLVELVPIKYKNSPLKYFATIFNSNRISKRDRYALEWSAFELSLCKPFLSRKDILQICKGGAYLSLSQIEAHYIFNGCFISEDYIIKNSGKIRNISSWIVHGQYDFVCPPIESYRLNNVLKRSKLSVVNGGHSSSDPEIELGLKNALLEFSRGCK